MNLECPDDDVIAPGDNVPRSKLELEIENHVLNATAKLSDGTEGRVFSRLPRNKDLVFGYSCHICGVVCLHGERMLQIHIAGRKHQARLNVAVFDAEQYRAALVIKPKGSTTVSDGAAENVSPGDVPDRTVREEPSSTPKARLQGVLDGYREGPLVGLEYIVELTDGNVANDPFYSCMVCNINDNSESGITTHMISLQHRLKFLQRHYPTVRNILAPFRHSKTDNGAQVFCRVVQTVCEAIEDHHGRMAPRVCERGDFERNRVKHTQDITFGSHFDEHTGPKFVEVIDHKVLENLANAEDRTGQEAEQGEEGQGSEQGTGTVRVTGAVKRYRNRNDRGSLDSISSISSANSVLSISSSDADVAMDPGRLQKRTPPNGGPSEGGEPYVISGQRVDYRRVESSDDWYRIHPVATPKQQVIPTPKELSMQSAAIAHERYKWEKYRCTLEIAVAQLTKNLKDYEKNPEKHPLYSEEWKKFWNRRYKELQLEKKDPQKHNFKPEWIEFWTKRMKELHSEEIEQKKVEIRAKMNLPAEGEERTDELREQFVLRVPPAGTKQSRSSECKPDQARPETVLVDVNSEEEEDDYKGGQPTIGKARRRSRSPGRGDRDWERPRYRSTSRSRRSRSRGSRSRRSRSRRSRSRRSRSRASRSRRSRSPMSDNSDMDGYYRRYSTRGGYPMERERYTVGGAPTRVAERVDYDTWAKNYYGPNKKVFVRTEFDAENDMPLNFIAVCRLLTAFEEYLGSLGPKVIDLMAKALALEKVKANSADDLLLNEDNCMFLETVKEKLKGHMMAETIDLPKMTPIKKAVRNIARLLHEVSKREPVEKPAEEEVSRDSLLVSDVTAPVAPVLSGACGPDKIAIAEQLAKALVAQGKTDFTTEELEQLINVYTAMEKMSREKNTITTTKAYMAALAPSAAVATPEAKEVSPKVPDRPRMDAPIRPQVGRDSRRTERENFRTVGVSGSASTSTGIESDEPDVASASGGIMLENLGDSDLQALLQGFKELSNEEQMYLISHLRKLERTEPERVERLRRYVDFDSWNDPSSRDYDYNRRHSDDEERDYSRNDVDDGFGTFRTSTASQPATAGRKQTQSNKAPSNHQQMPNHQQKMPNRQKEQQQSTIQLQQEKARKLLDDSEDEDDYTYDDILRAASKNVSKTSVEAHDSSSSNSHRTNANEAAGSAVTISLADTQNLIANLMESLQKTVSDANSSKPADDYTSPITTISSRVGAGSGGAASSSNPVGNMAATGSNNSVAIASYYSSLLPQAQQRTLGLQRPPGPQGLQMSSNMSAQQMGLPQQQLGQAQVPPTGQPQGQSLGSAMGQMQQPFGQAFMYQGQMFGANAAQQAQQYGYGNFGYY